MDRYRILKSNLRYYFRRNLVVALGMAIGVTVITGALVTGDSVRSGLRDLVGLRLGKVDLAVSAGERYLTDSLAIRLSQDLAIPAAAVLQLGGSVTAGGGTIRVPKVLVWGVDTVFRATVGPGTFDPPLNADEAVISDNLAARLNVKAGDEILIRFNKPRTIPQEAPFVSDEDNILSLAVRVKAIPDKESHGRFHLQNTQAAPFNVFINKRNLQELTGMQGLSNLILLAGEGALSVDRVEKSLAAHWSIRDAGLTLDRHPVTGEWMLRSTRIFFDPPTLLAIHSASLIKSLWFSYFVNEFRIGTNTTPYSFVSTLPDDRVLPGDIIINRWLAEDLNAQIGDTVFLRYFLVGPLRNLTEEISGFRITGIVPMDDPRSDRLLMPEIPGLAGAGNCRDWESGIPIDLSRIRDKDEDYWTQFRGTPKAFINPGQAAGLWQNRFGSFTQVRFSPGQDRSVIQSSVLSGLYPPDVGMQVSEPTREGVTAASSGVDFSGLFLGLSFFLVAGGLILTVLLIRLNLHDRIDQIGTLRAIGWSDKLIRNLLLAEQLIVTLTGALIGLAFTFLYTVLIFNALKGVWNDIVLTDTLSPVFHPGTLAAGTGIGILVSAATAWFALVRSLRRSPAALQKKLRPAESPRVSKILLGSSIFFILSSLFFVVYGLFHIQSVAPTVFFLGGTLLLSGLLLLAIRQVRFHDPLFNKQLSLNVLSQTNLWRSSTRSLSVIILFAIGIFLVIAIGANRKMEVGDKGTGAQGYKGTGGFLYYLETTVPVTDNLNIPQVKAKYGLEAPSEFVQMKKLEGDDASCLNLNRVSNPPLLGVPAGSLKGRFRFASLADQRFRDDPWSILEQQLPGGAIPAVADQTVIQWSLGMQPGDTLRYLNEKGDTVKLVLVGGLANSVFQGNILVAEDLFIRHWPSVNGTCVTLVSADQELQETAGEELRRVFRDYGADLQSASRKLAVFNSVENTYLSIFLVMGALAVLIGTIGLAIVLIRNLQERGAEMALLRATGFSRRRILGLIFREYSMLLVYGTLAGALPAGVTVLPVLVNPSGEVSFSFLLMITLIMIAHGLAWILILGWSVIRNVSQDQIPGQT